MSVEVRGLAEVTDALGDLAERAGDLRPVWPRIGRLWSAREAQVFSSAGLGRWAPLAAATLVRKPSGAPPLVRTGSLLAALTRVEPRFGDQGMAAFGPPKDQPEDTAIGSRLARGTSRMPARSPVPRLRAGERRAMFGLVRDHVGEGLE